MSGLTQAKSSWALNVALVDGAAANTDMAITGILTDDTLLFALHMTTKAAIESFLDYTSSTSITSDGNIQNTNVTTDDQFLIFYLRNSV